MRFTKEYFEQYLRLDHESGLMVWIDSPKKSKEDIGKVAGVIDVEGYCIINIGRSRHRAHRIVWVMMTSEQPDQIDHINGIRSDNRFENLRSVSNQQNARNQRLKENNTSGHAGVAWHKKHSKWISYIRVDGRMIYLGLFSEKENAVNARRHAELEYGFHENHGKFRPRYEHS